MRSLADGVKTYDQVVEVCPNLIVLLVFESFANAASCIPSPWRRVDVSRILPVSPKGSYSRMHCELVQSVTCLPSESIAMRMLRTWLTKHGGWGSLSAGSEPLPTICLCAASARNGEEAACRT